MGVEDVVQRTQDALTVRRVFGDPYEKDGITVIPTARLTGGAGGGGGQDPGGQTGSGGGFGLRARPVGAFVIKGGEVSWRPAFDATRVALFGEVVALAAILTVRTIVRTRARTSRRRQRAEGSLPT